MAAPISLSGGEELIASEEQNLSHFNYTAPVFHGTHTHTDTHTHTHMHRHATTQPKGIPGLLVWQREVEMEREKK